MVKLTADVIENLTKREQEAVALGKRVADYNFNEKDVKAFGEFGLTPSVAVRRGAKSEELQGAFVEAARRQSAQVESNTQIANKVIKDLKLNKQDATDFNTLVIYGRDYQVEFDKNTLDGWGLNDNVQNGYRAYLKQSQDAQVSANSLMRKQLSKEGWQTSTKTGDIAKEFNNSQLSSPEFSKMMILDPDTGEILNYRNSSVEAINDKYLSKGYKLYQMYPGEITARDLGYTHYLSKAPDELTELSQWVLPYVKGGSNGYTPNTHFVKIGRDFYDNEGGRIFHGFPKTLVADENVKRLEKYAEEVNQVSDMWNRNQGDLAAIQRELDTANFQEFKVTSATDVKSLMKTKENPEGLIDPNYQAKVLRNNEKYVYGDQGYGIEQLEEFDHTASNLMDIRGNYYRSRGDRILANLNNDYGHVIDPFTMWQRNIEQEAFNNTIGRLMVDYGDWFKETYGAVIDTKNGKYNINRMSGREVIATADIKAPSSEYDELARSARRAQATYLNILNTPTKLDVYISTKMQELLHRLPKRFWDNKYVDGLMNSNVIGWSNAIVYRTYLGFFNLKQFVLQGPLQMLNTLSIAPVKGTQALVSLPAIVLGHFFKDTPVVKYIPKLLAGMGGISQKEYDGFMKFIDDYGTFKQFSKRPELAADMETWLRTHNQIDLIFAQAGNNMSQLLADLTAYLIDGGKNTRNICRISDDLMLNLNRANTSIIQRSAIGKIAAQFTSYPLAAYEIMTGHHLTGWQRARFTAMQLGLWGIGGTFARDYTTNLYDYLKEHTNADPEILSYALEGVGTKFFEDLGTYVNEGVDLLGMINQMSSLVAVMSDMFGTAPELPVSNIPTIIIDGYNTVKDLLDPKTNEFDLLHWAKETNKRRGAPSGIKNITKYIYARDARAFLDRNGDVLRENPTELQQWAALLGFGPVEAKFDYNAVKRENTMREHVRNEFETKVREYIDAVKTFSDTGKGDTELIQTRGPNFGYVMGNAEAAVREFYAYVDKFHPEFSRYARNLVDRAYTSGENKKYRRTKAQTKYYEEQSQE